VPVDLEFASVWYDDQQSGLGADFLRAVQRGFDRIAINPETGFIVGRGIRMWMVEGFPNGIIFSPARRGFADCRSSPSSATTRILAASIEGRMNEAAAINSGRESPPGRDSGINRGIPDSFTVIGTLADLLHELGDISPERVLRSPHPGTATEDDLLRLLNAADKRLCELVDGVLVEKPMGWYEARLATILCHLIEAYLEERDIGFIVGPDAPHRLHDQCIRLPDVAFVRYETLPPPEQRRAAVASWVPDLAVEILSESNRPGEMTRNLQDYFNAGVRLAWMADPESRTVRVYHSPDQFETLAEADSLDGEDVLPGFRLSIRDWFTRADRARSGGGA
jgi:Uma2 family endonuclease